MQEAACRVASSLSPGATVTHSHSVTTDLSDNHIAIFIVNEHGYLFEIIN